MQSNVKKLYLQVINNVVDKLRDDFEQSGYVDADKHLKTLKTRWTENLMGMSNFEDDPLFMPAATRRTNRKSISMMHTTVVSTGPSPRRTAKREIRQLQTSSISNITHDSNKSGGTSNDAVKLSSDSANPGVKESSSDTLRKRNIGELFGANNKANERPASKRVRREGNGLNRAANNDEVDPDMKSDLDSSSSDQGKNQENDCSDFLLAEITRAVKRGGQGIFKFFLKGGVASLNSRDYLFNDAICRFDW